MTEIKCLQADLSAKISQYHHCESYENRTHFLFVIASRFHKNGVAIHKFSVVFALCLATLTMMSVKRLKGNHPLCIAVMPVRESSKSSKPLSSAR